MIGTIIIITRSEDTNRNDIDTDDHLLCQWNIVSE
jgi:hypothetical protein